ncbi:MAG: hypothetical protein DRH57_09190 [Candidatus Cloacimonadota bacterium]|nr:MAG: hypothetical protein DRH57_09190 [Candidatus Cloacimonadota bacterium]
MLLADLIEKELEPILREDWGDADTCILFMLEEKYPLLEEQITTDDISVATEYVNNASVELSPKFSYYCELFYPELLV